MTDTYTADPRVKLKRIASPSQVPGGKASYDVYVDGKKVGCLRATYSRIAGASQRFEGKVAVHAGSVAVRGPFRAALDKAAITTYEAIMAKEAARK